MTPNDLKITIVAHGLRAGGGVSVGKNLISAVFNQRADACYQVFVPANPDYRSIASPNERSSIIYYEAKGGLIGRWLYDKFQLTRQIEHFSPDIIVCLGNLGVDQNNAPQILLVQDSHLFYPQKHYSRENFLRLQIYRYRRHRFSADLTKSSVVLCQTRTAGDRIKRTYGYSGKLGLLPNAVSINTEAGAALAARTSHQPGDKFNLFYLTSYYPHKNIEIFIDLFRNYRRELKDVVLYLTIAPHQHPYAKKLLEAVESNDLGENIVNLGPIKQEEIGSYFSRMNALVMPTTLESFSGSYIEAMTFDCPILTSDLDFAREVCEDAALYFDPWSVDSLFAALRQIMENPALAAELAAKGRRVLQTKNLSWEKNAAYLLEKIDSTLQDRSSKTLPTVYNRKIHHGRSSP